MREQVITTRRSFLWRSAAGEGVQGHFGYRELLVKQSARIWQPDVARAGGLTAMRKIAALADTGYIGVAPHNPNGPVCTAASMHFAAATPNFLIMEEGNRETGQYNDIFAGGWKTNFAYWTVPESPGLGVDFSAPFLREYEIKL